MSTEKIAQKGYKRINFFKGFLTTESDWNEAEKYHVEKRKLHGHLLQSIACRAEVTNPTVGIAVVDVGGDGKQFTVRQSTVDAVA